jgi:hypothetical protein
MTHTIQARAAFLGWHVSRASAFPSLGDPNKPRGAVRNVTRAASISNVSLD